MSKFIVSMIAVLRPSNAVDTIESYDPKTLEYPDEAIKYKNESLGKDKVVLVFLS